MLKKNQTYVTNEGWMKGKIAAQRNVMKQTTKLPRDVPLFVIISAIYKQVTEPQDDWKHIWYMRKAVNYPYPLFYNEKYPSAPSAIAKHKLPENRIVLRPKYASKTLPRVAKITSIIPAIKEINSLVNAGFEFYTFLKILLEKNKKILMPVNY